MDAFYEQSGFVPSKANLRRLAMCNFLPLALLAFWLWPTGQMVCVIYDEWLFYRFNSPLFTNPIWDGSVMLAVWS